MAPSDMDLYAMYPGSFFLGLSATPALTDGRPMAMFWQRLINTATMQAMIDHGLLVGNHIFEPRAFASDRLRRGRDGDFALSDHNAAVVEEQNPIGDVTRDWRLYSGGVPTLAFCTTIRKSQELVAYLNREGVSALHIDMHTSPGDRDTAKAASAAGEIKIVSSVDVMGYGVDWPHIGCCIHLRPCGHVVPWIQFCGRANRSAPGKAFAVQIDHVGNTRRLGWPEDYIDWHLEEGRVTSERKRGEREEKTLECRQCRALVRPGRRCECCGAEPPPRAEILGRVEMQPGKLTVAQRGRTKSRRTPAQVEWDHALGVAIGAGRTVRSAMAMFRRRTGFFPNRRELNKVPAYEHLDMNARDWYDRVYKKGRDDRTA